MPITVSDPKGVPDHRRERIEAAGVAGSENVSAPYEAWIAANPFRGVLVQREVESWRSPLVSITPFSASQFGTTSPNALAAGGTGGC